MKLAIVFVLGFALGAISLKIFSKNEPCPETVAGAQVCAPETVTAKADPKRSLLPHPPPAAEAESGRKLEPTPESEAQEDLKAMTDDGGGIAGSAVASKVKEGSLAGVKDARDAQSFLRNNRWKDAMQKILSSKPISEMDPQVEALIGKFAGDVMVRGGRTWQMVFELDGNVVNSQFRGKLSVTLSENGKVFSQHSGQGPIREVRKVGGSQAIYLEASPRHHFQLFTVPDSDMMIGTLYMNDRNPGEYRVRGQAQLYRQ